MVGFLAIVSGLSEHSSAPPAAAAVPLPKVGPTNVPSRNVQGGHRLCEWANRWQLHGAVTADALLAACAGH